MHETRVQSHKLIWYDWQKTKLNFDSLCSNSIFYKIRLYNEQAKQDNELYKYIIFFKRRRRSPSTAEKIFQGKSEKVCTVLHSLSPC